MPDITRFRLNGIELSSDISFSLEDTLKLLSSYDLLPKPSLAKPSKIEAVVPSEQATLAIAEEVYPLEVLVRGKIKYKIVCFECGKFDTVQFKPLPEQVCLCGSCHKAAKGKKASSNSLEYDCLEYDW
jgi:hypothetical protein